MKGKTAASRCASSAFIILSGRRYVNLNRAWEAVSGLDLKSGVLYNICTGFNAVFIVWEGEITVLKYETAYFCAYAKLPSVLATTAHNGMLTLGLKLRLETADIEDVSVSLITPLAVNMVRSYFIGRNLLRDYDDIIEEISYRHQGNACKSIIKAAGDIHRNYIEYMAKNRDVLTV